MPETPHNPESAWLRQYYTDSKTPAEIPPDDGLSLAELLTPVDGEKYAVTGQVGGGGMKMVHRARDRNANRDVALAMLRKAAPRSAQERRFLREARITAALEHPNIVPVHEIGLDTRQRPYFTMKLLGGKNLHDILNHLDPRQYPLARLLDIFDNVCQAVAFAHARGIVHLDLKPANIQVASFGEVLVLDWGLAKVLEGSAVELPAALREMPVDGVARGTPGYMAPEQERGDFAALDQRTDVYALGAVLCALLGSQRQVIPPLAAVAAKAKADDARDRYQSVAELEQDIRAFAGGFAVSAQAVGVRTLLWLWVKRHKAVAGITAVSLVTLAGLLSVFIVQIKQSEQRAREALQRTIQSEQRAVNALTQLREEQAEKVRIGRMAIYPLLAHAQQLIQAASFDEALSEFSLIVLADSNIAQAWTWKGFLHLGRLEFAEAMAAFDRVPALARRPKRDAQMRPGELAEKYRDLQAAAGPLTLNQVQQLIGELRGKPTALPFYQQQPVFGQLFQHLNQTRKRDDEHLKFLQASLVSFNPQTSNLVFEATMEANGLVVTVRGNQLNQLLPLTGLPIYALDLSGTAVSEVHWLRYSGLQSLNLAGTPCADITSLVHLPLTELNVANAPRFGLAQLPKFPQLKKITVTQGLLASAQGLWAQSREPPEIVGK